MLHELSKLDSVALLGSNSHCKPYERKQEISATPKKVKIGQSRHLLEDNDHCDPFEKIRHLRVQYPKNIIVSYININSVRHKFDNFVHILCIS